MDVSVNEGEGEIFVTNLNLIIVESLRVFLQHVSNHIKLLCSFDRFKCEEHWPRDVAFFEISEGGFTQRNRITRVIEHVVGKLEAYSKVLRELEETLLLVELSIEENRDSLRAERHQRCCLIVCLQEVSV